MSRFNLICNGMMFFNEVNDRLQIVIPDIDGHVRKFNQDPVPTKASLMDLPIGRYTLDLPSSNRMPLTELLDGAGYVVLDGRRVAFNEERAARISAIIDVPKPTIIRMYRATEPLPGFDMLGNCRDLVVRTPRIAHDILVLSYKEIPVGTSVGLESAKGTAVAAGRTAMLSTINWMLYSNEKAPFPAELAFAGPPDLELNAALAPFRHPTEINTFLEIDELGGTGRRATTLQLSCIGKKDAPPSSTAIDVSDRHLFLFDELPDDPQSAVVQPRSGPGGCSGGARATQLR